MRCRAFKKWIWRNGAAELPPNLAAHLDGCDACREFCSEVRTLDLALAKDPTPDPGELYWEDFGPRLARRLEGGYQPTVVLIPQSGGWARWVRRWVPVVGVAFLAVLMGRTVIDEQPPGVGSESDVAVQRSLLTAPGMIDPDQTPGGALDGQLEARQNLEAPASSSIEVDVSLQPRITPGQDAASTEPAATMSPVVADHAERSTSRLNAELADASSGVATGADTEVWPERQVISLGEVSTETPSQLSGDEGRLAEQGSYGSFERRMAHSGLASETAGVHHMPGRLLDGPRLQRPPGFADGQSPAEAMRRFDEVRELRAMIGELSSVPVAMRGEEERTRLSTLWYRLGAITAETVLLDSAIQVLNEYIETLPADTRGEWSSRRDQLLGRRELLD
jgi:hypothetical protein